MKIFQILAFLMAVAPCMALAQGLPEGAGERPPSQVSDSIIMSFHRDFGKNKYETIQMIDDIMSVEYFEAENEEGHIVLDSLCCDINGVFKYCRIRRQGSKVLVEYHTGEYGQVHDLDEWDYYYDGGRLLQTIYTHHRQSGEPFEDYGVYEFVEEKRVVFVSAGQPPLYIYREGEGYSQQFDISEVPFEQFDVKNLLYDKYMFETVGAKILNNDRDI